MVHLLADDAGMTVYIGCPDQLGGKDGRLVLADFYGEVLGWHRYDAYGTPFLSKSPAFRIGFDGDGWSDQRPPRWPDPKYPQQIHFDIAVSDLDVADTLVTAVGGALLQDNTSHRIYADPAGHPLCLYSGSSSAATEPTVARLVYDCFSPRSLARFYEGFLGVPDRLDDSTQRVVIDLDDDDLPNLAFNTHSSLRPAGPTPPIQHNCTSTTGSPSTTNSPTTKPQPPKPQWHVPQNSVRSSYGTSFTRIRLGTHSASEPGHPTVKTLASPNRRGAGNPLLAKNGLGQ